MAKITEKTYNAITGRLNKYMEQSIPHMLGDTIEWGEDIDNLETTGIYTWRAYHREENTSYWIHCNWNTKKCSHETKTGEWF